MPTKRAALYARVSTDRQANEGDSIPAQLTALRRYVQEHGYVIAGEYVDDGISGAKSDRDELQRMLSDIDRIDVILVTKLDRLYRSIRHYLNMMDVLDSHSVGWTAIWESYDTTTPQGRLIVNQMMAFAQFEAENTGQRIRQVFAYKAEKGEVLSGVTPAGYRIENKRLVPSETADSVRTAFEEYARTNNLSETLRRCAGLQGLPRTTPAFKRMLMNPVYIGIKYGREGVCPPLVDRGLFEDVQRGIARNVKISQKETYLFSGMIRCKRCGTVLGAKTRRTNHGKPACIHQYQCRKHFGIKPPACSNLKVVNENVLERDLLARIRPTMEGIVLECRKREQQKKPDRNAAIRKRLVRLKEAYLNDVISLEEYKRDREQLEKQLLPEQEVNISKYTSFLETDFESLYAVMDPEQKRRFWRTIIKTVWWSDDRSIEVEWY